MTVQAPKTIMTPDEVVADLSRTHNSVVNPVKKASKTKIRDAAPVQPFMVGNKEGTKTEGHHPVSDIGNVCSCGFPAKTATNLGKHRQKFNANSELRKATYDTEAKGWFVTKTHPFNDKQVQVRVA